MIQPTLDNVLITKYNLKSDSPIVIPKNIQNNKNTTIYKVVAVGPGGKINDVQVDIFVAPDDIVLIPEYIGSEINIDGKDYRIVKQNEILAILNLD